MNEFLSWMPKRFIPVTDIVDDNHLFNWERDRMAIDKKEIERIIDDFETKAENYREENKNELKRILSDNEGRAEELEYCAAVLRQVLPHEN